MFALALHSRRENEKRASEKRRATITSARLQQRASQNSLHPIPKQIQPSTNADQQPPTADQQSGKKPIDPKSRSYSAITVIRTKAPEDVLSAAGVNIARGGKPDEQQKDQPEAVGRSKSTSAEETDLAPSTTVLRESGPRVLVVRMTPDQHKAAAAKLKRQLTQPAIYVQVPSQESAARKPPPLEKKLSK